VRGKLTFLRLRSSFRRVGRILLSVYHRRQSHLVVLPSA